MSTGLRDYHSTVFAFVGAQPALVHPRFIFFANLKYKLTLMRTDFYWDETQKLAASVDARAFRPFNHPDFHNLTSLRYEHLTTYYIGGDS